MESLERFTLVVGDLKVGISEVLQGDATAVELARARMALPKRISFGATASDALALAKKIGERGKVRDGSGRVIGEVKLEKVDTTLSVVQGEWNREAT